MLGSAVMSEIFYRQGFPTERCLVVIDYGDGSSIGVRTAPNLVRPAHLFRYLKQGRHDELKRALDYFLDRQEKNGFWKLPARVRPPATPRGLDHRALLRQARGGAGRGIHLQLARLGRRQRARRRLDPRLRLHPPVRGQARQVPLRGRRSLLHQPATNSATGRA